MIVAMALVAWSRAIVAQRTEPAAFDLIALYSSARLVATGQGASITDPDAILPMEHEVAPQRVRLLNNPCLT